MIRPYLFERRFLFLLILIVIMIVVIPFIDYYTGLHFFVEIVVSAIFIAAIYAISTKNRYLIFALFLVGPRIATLWINYFVEIKWVVVIGGMCGVLFFAFAIIQIVNFIRNENEVSTEVIYAAVVVYLLMALAWSNIYQIMEILIPGSFSLPEGQIDNPGALFTYFSIVTITTLGYGDITPLTGRASALTAIEAFIGQIYLVVLVAWLVGMHVSKRSK